MASEHTAKAFDSDLQELTRLVAEMGGLAERMITDSVDALVRRDVALSKRVVAADGEIDTLQRTIEERAVLTIARRQPMAIDLREIVGSMRVATDLERIGDLAKNIERIGDHATNIAETVFYMIEGQQMVNQRPKGDMTTFATTVPGN